MSVSPTKGNCTPRRQYADDGVRRVIERDRLADDVAVAAKAATPQ